jgi:hypothetical protein
MFVVKSARAAALKVLLAHFPNVPFLMRDARQTFDAETESDLPAAMEELRTRLQSDLRSLNSIDTASTVNTNE